MASNKINFKVYISFYKHEFWHMGAFRRNKNTFFNNINATCHPSKSKKKKQYYSIIWLATSTAQYEQYKDLRMCNGEHSYVNCK